MDNNAHDLYMWAGINADFALFQLDNRTRLERLTRLPNATSNLRFVAVVETRFSVPRSLELGFIKIGTPY